MTHAAIIIASMKMMRVSIAMSVIKTIMTMIVFGDITADNDDDDDGDTTTV